MANVSSCDDRTRLNTGDNCGVVDFALTPGLSERVDMGQLHASHPPPTRAVPATGHADADTSVVTGCWARFGLGHRPWQPGQCLRGGS